MQRSYLYSLNKDLLIKIIEELGDLEKWDFSKLNFEETALKNIKDKVKDEIFRKKAEIKIETIRKEILNDFIRNTHFPIKYNDIYLRVSDAINTLNFVRKGIQYKDTYFTRDELFKMDYEDYKDDEMMYVFELLKEEQHFDYKDNMSMYECIREYILDDSAPDSLFDWMYSFMK